MHTLPLLRCQLRQVHTVQDIPVVSVHRWARGAQQEPERLAVVLHAHTNLAAFVIDRPLHTLERQPMRLLLKQLLPRLVRNQPPRRKVGVFPTNSVWGRKVDAD